jgi:hypothetical protein
LFIASCRLLLPKARVKKSSALLSGSDTDCWPSSDRGDHRLWASNVIPSVSARATSLHSSLHSASPQHSSLHSASPQHSNIPTLITWHRGVSASRRLLQSPLARAPPGRTCSRVCLVPNHQSDVPHHTIHAFSPPAHACPQHQRGPVKKHLRSSRCYRSTHESTRTT